MAVVHYDAAPKRGVGKSPLVLARKVVAALMSVCIGLAAYLLFAPLSPAILLKTAMAVCIFALLAMLIGHGDEGAAPSPGPWG